MERNEHYKTPPTSTLLTPHQTKQRGTSRPPDIKKEYIEKKNAKSPRLDSAISCSSNSSHERLSLREKRIGIEDDMEFFLVTPNGPQPREDIGMTPFLSTSFFQPLQLQSDEGGTKNKSDIRPPLASVQENCTVENKETESCHSQRSNQLPLLPTLEDTITTREVCGNRNTQHRRILTTNLKQKKKLMMSVVEEI